jgi:hypothetical protein
MRKKQLFATLCSILLITACTKIITTELGTGLIPPIDGVFTKDTTLEVFAKNAGFDTTVVQITDDNILGYLNDPLFGETSAEINIQFRPSYYPFLFADTGKRNIFFDSVVLILNHRGYVGDTTQPLSFRVNLIDGEEFFVNDSIYKSSQQFGFGEELTYNNLPYTVHVPDLADSVKPDPFNEKAANQLRIRLSDEFGEKLLYEWDTAGLGAYKADSLFDPYHRGITIRPEKTGNAMIRINLLDTNTKIGIYYRYSDTSGGFDTSVRYLRVNQFASAHSNFIHRKYSTPAQIASYFPPNNDAEDSLIYIQASPGTYANLKIPGLSGLPNMIVHRAELLFDQVYDVSDQLSVAPNLFLAAYSKDSAQRFAIPYDAQIFNGQIGNLSTLGVNPKPKADPLSGTTISSYNFDISRYVQSVVTRKEKDYDLVLWAPYFDIIYPIENTDFQIAISSTPLNFAGLGRVRVGGGNYSRNPMRLHIVYSVVP